MVVGEMNLNDAVQQLMADAAKNTYEFTEAELNDIIREVALDCARVSLDFYPPMYNYQARCGREIAQAIEKKYGISFGVQS
jgi:hypothetical protein